MRAQESPARPRSRRVYSPAESPRRRLYTSRSHCSRLHEKRHRRGRLRRRPHRAAVAAMMIRLSMQQLEYPPQLLAVRECTFIRSYLSYYCTCPSRRVLCAYFVAGVSKSRCKLSITVACTDGSHRLPDATAAAISHRDCTRAGRSIYTSP